MVYEDHFNSATEEYGPVFAYSAGTTQCILNLVNRKCNHLPYVSHLSVEKTEA